MNGVVVIIEIINIYWFKFIRGQMFRCDVLNDLLVWALHSIGTANYNKQTKQKKSQRLIEHLQPPPRWMTSWDRKQLPSINDNSMCLFRQAGHFVNWMDVNDTHHRVCREAVYNHRLRISCLRYISRVKYIVERNKKLNTSLNHTPKSIKDRCTRRAICCKFSCHANGNVQHSHPEVSFVCEHHIWINMVWLCFVCVYRALFSHYCHEAADRVCCGRPGVTILLLLFYWQQSIRAKPMPNIRTRGWRSRLWVNVVGEIKRWQSLTSVNVWLVPWHPSHRVCHEARRKQRQQQG